MSTVTSLLLSFLRDAWMAHAGAFLAFAPLSVYFWLGNIFGFAFSPWLFLPVVIFPAVMGYNIMRFRFLRTDDLARRGVMYILLTGLVTLGYALVSRPTI